jgi:hypothetical protein
MKTATRLAGLGLLALGAAAHAETTDCTEITSAPYQITAPGIYCLKASLSYSGPGTAIGIGANDVVIDLNGHVLDGSAAGPASNTTGIAGHFSNNVTVRNGTIRGFRDGINLGRENGNRLCNDAEGYVVERMRLEHNVWHGAVVEGRASVVRNNTVFDTGNGTGSTGSSGNPRGLYLCGDGVQVTDNQILDTVEVAGGTAHGINVRNSIGAVVERNVVGNSKFGPGSSTGIELRGSGNTAVGNRVINMRTGIHFVVGGGIYMDNTVGGAITPFLGGTAAGATNFSF